MTKWDYIVDIVVAYKIYIGVTGIGLGIASVAGWISLPELEFWHWFILSALVGGLTIGSSAVLYELSDYLADRRVRVILAPVQTGLA